MMPRALPHVFVRHPPIPQAQGLCYGRTDYGLPATTYVTAATALRERHTGLDALPILCSPARRCRDLALALALHHAREQPLRSDARLLEMDFGRWEGRAWSSLPRVELDRWATDVAGYRPPEGECFVDVIARVGEALTELRAPHTIVAHGGVIRAAWHLLGGVPIAEAASMRIDYLEPITITAR
jgi:alpha-ribazole phosphatase